jgi:hypothetical protein
MKCKATGIVKSVEPWQKFNSSNGKELNKWSAVVDIDPDGKYNNPIPLQCWDREKIPSDVGVGDKVEVEFWLKGRETSSGKVFLNCNVQSLTILERMDREEPDEPEDEGFEEVSEDEDLPF